jgi:hypothetical protein
MPIHRKRPTKHFTSIENRVLRDKNLNGEAKGLLAWLLTQHPNWKIIIPVVAREMQWGRDKTYRLLKRLQELGYIYREQERNNGTGSFGEVVYYVYSDTADNPHLPDRPLPDLPLPENSKASKERSNKIQEIPPTPERDVRAPGEQCLAHHGAPGFDRQLPSVQEDKALKSLAGQQNHVGFEKFWNAYGPEPYMSKTVAQRVWLKMSEADRQQAFLVLASYIADCKTSNRKRHNVARYLRDKIYQGYSKQAQRTAGFSLRPYSSQWQAWHDYMIARGDDVTFMESRAQQGHDFTATSQWPPS